MNTIKNTKVNTSASAKAITAKAYFTTDEVADMLNITVNSLSCYLFKHKELRKSARGLWTIEEVEKLIEFRSKARFKNCNNSKITAEELKALTENTSIAIPETTKTTAVSTNTATAENLIAMFDAFLEIEQEEQRSENRAANRKFRYLFDNMTEKDIQEFFKPLTERFKFSYVTKVIDDIQSQTLTCIKNGRLKGIEKYKLTYTTFLHLCKFAAENNCPLNIPQTQTM